MWSATLWGSCCLYRGGWCSVWAAGGLLWWRSVSLGWDVVGARSPLVRGAGCGLRSAVGARRAENWLSWSASGAAGRWRRLVFRGCGGGVAAAGFLCRAARCSSAGVCRPAGDGRCLPRRALHCVVDCAGLLLEKTETSASNRFRGSVLSLPQLIYNSFKYYKQILIVKCFLFFICVK